jgi:hypothetical protein
LPACPFCACACLLSHHATSAVARSSAVARYVCCSQRCALLSCLDNFVSFSSKVDSILHCSPSTYCPLSRLFAYTGLVPKTPGVLQQVVSQMVHLQGILPLRHLSVYVRVCTPLSCVLCVCIVCVWVRAQQSGSLGTWRRQRLRLLALPDVDECSLVYVIVRAPLASGIFVNTICRQAGGLGGSVCGASLLSFRARSQGRAN